MKWLGILLIVVSGGLGVKTYTDFLKEQLSCLKDWQMIFRFWREQIENFGFSVPEMIENLSTNITLRELKTVQAIAGKTTDEIVRFLQSESIMSDSDKELIIQTVNGLGSTLSNTQLKEFDNVNHELDLRIKEKECSVKERSQMLYKLAPLVCGAIAVLLW